MVDQNDELHPPFPLVCLISREKLLDLSFLVGAARLLVQWCRRGATYREDSEHEGGRAKPREFCRRVLLLSLVEQLCAIGIVAVAGR